MECKKTRNFCKLLKQHGCKVVVFAGGSVYQEAGIPDRFICHYTLNKGCWAEFKDTTTAIKDIQRKHIEDFRLRGVNAVFARFTVDGGIDLFVRENKHGYSVLGDVDGDNCVQAFLSGLKVFEP